MNEEHQNGPIISWTRHRLCICKDRKTYIIKQLINLLYRISNLFRPTRTNDIVFVHVSPDNSNFWFDFGGTGLLLYGWRDMTERSSNISNFKKIA